EGESGKMASIVRVSDKPYRVSYGLVDIDVAANAEKKVPEEWINASGNDVTEKMMAYLVPLIQGESRILWKNGIPSTMVLY
ncbi:MAG: 6-phosphofructokinase, partial [Eubacterium sp.]|nr:6-phosphofructokinase [Eubacterium sp.]